MNRQQFLTFFISLNILFIFSKIYQHNSLVRLTYEKQRYEQKTETLKKTYNVLYAQLLTMASLETVKNKATHEWGMTELKFAKIKPVTSLIATTTWSILSLEPVNTTTALAERSGHFDRVLKETTLTTTVTLS